MSDVMTPEQRSRAMSHIKGKDTSIEVYTTESTLAQRHPVSEKL